MQELKDYVDFVQYCKALSEITNINIENVIKIVKDIFDEIGAGNIDPILGFERIEDELASKMSKQKRTKKVSKKLFTRQHTY